MRNKKAKLIPTNKILSVSIRHMLDENPDTSWLGEYGSSAESDYAIDRRHSEDCACVSLPAQDAKEKLERIADYLSALSNDCDCASRSWYGDEHDSACPLALEDIDAAFDCVTQLAEEITECDCGGNSIGSREFEYFNPNWENYKGLPAEEIRKYCRQDYERMEQLERGYFHFIGIRAECSIGIPQPHFSSNGTPYLTQKLTSGGLWGIESDQSKTDFEETEREQLDELRDVLSGLGFSRRAISMSFKNVDRKDL
jgi:hypothetical protein